MYFNGKVNSSLSSVVDAIYRSHVITKEMVALPLRSLFLEDLNPGGGYTESRRGCNKEASQEDSTRKVKNKNAIVTAKQRAIQNERKIFSPETLVSKDSTVENPRLDGSL